MAFSTTKQIEREESIQDTARFLRFCLLHVTKTSRKPVSGRYLIETYGDYLSLRDGLILNEIRAAVPLLLNWSVGREYISMWLDNLKALEPL